MLNVDEITTAYRVLQENKVIYASALETSTGLDVELERAKANALANGTVQGKNDTERKAALNTLFSDEIHALEMAEIETRHARLDVELAELEVKRIETLVRWLK